MMFSELYQYLIHYNKLPVPGIGTFLLEKKPATADFPNRLIHPPSYEISMQSLVPPPSRNFFSWLGTILQVTEREAVTQFNDFVFNIREQVNAGDTIYWKGVGVISKGFAGDIKFSPDPVLIGEPVKAEKVIREKAEHMVRVGEDQKSSGEMQAILHHREEKRSYWWVYAAAVALLAIMFIGWYFSEHGVNVSSTANTNEITPVEVTPASRILP